jgi:hypothetical protein
MKKALLGLILSGLLIATSCKKPGPYNSGSFAFKSVTYANSYTTIDTVLHQIQIDNSSNPNNINSGGVITIHFYDSLPHFPPQPGTYLVTDTGARHTATNVWIGADIFTGVGNPDGYRSTNGNGNQKIQITISNNTMNITGTGIELVNVSNAADSAALSISVSSVLIY